MQSLFISAFTLSTSIALAYGSSATVTTTTKPPHPPAPVPNFTLLLDDPTLIECQIWKDSAGHRCDFAYDGIVIAEGPLRGPPAAAADCVKCKSIVNSARKQGLNILMDRRLNWNNDDFLSLTADDAPTQVCH